jgi:hypothetical protein
MVQYIEINKFRIGKRIVSNIKTENEQTIISLNDGELKLLINSEALVFIKDAIDFYLKSKQNVRLRKSTKYSNS